MKVLEGKARKKHLPWLSWTHWRASEAELFVHQPESSFS